MGSADRERYEAEIDALEEQVATLQDQVETLESEKASLEDQLDDALDPGADPAPTAELTVNWVRWVTPDQPSTVVCVTIENTSANASLIYSDSQFTAFDGDGFSYPIVTNPFFLTIPLQSGELGPGELRRGQIPFNVPPTSWPLTRLVWETGTGATPEVTVDLPPPADWTNADQC
jgi:hypothetical protein